MGVIVAFFFKFLVVSEAMSSLKPKYKTQPIRTISTSLNFQRVRNHWVHRYQQIQGGS